MKMKKKKILALVLAVVLLTAMIPSQATVLAGQSGGTRSVARQEAWTATGSTEATETDAAPGTADNAGTTQTVSAETIQSSDAGDVWTDDAGKAKTARLSEDSGFSETSGLSESTVTGGSPELDDESAESGTLVTDGAAYVNPIYDDVISEEDLTIPEAPEEGIPSQSATNGGISIASDDVESDSGISVASDDEGITYCETVEEAGAELREGMREREETIVIYYYGEVYSSDYFKELCTEYLIPEALEETENADEGDYIRYNYGGTGYRAAITADSNGDYRYYTITFTPTYFTTAEQEEEMDAAVDELLASEFAFASGTSEYDRLYAVYDYICSNVTYDSENLSDSTYTLKYTAYAALINGTAVCQGYATLYYRFLRELDLGVRVATGYGGVSSEDESNYYENHAWNIVQIGGKWYYVDSTWDASFSDEVAAGTYTYQYFLKGTTDFDTLESPYSTTGIHYLIMDEEFTDTYPIEATKYVKVIQVPSVTLAATQNNGKIKLTATITGYGDTDNYYEVTGEGFVYITKAKLGAKSLSVNTSGRTKVTITSSTMAAKYSYSMTPASASTNYVVRAWITYKNSSGKTVYVYSDAVYTSYNGLAN